eukprot:gene11226-17266_t
MPELNALTPELVAQMTKPSAKQQLLDWKVNKAKVQKLGVKEMRELLCVMLEKGHKAMVNMRLAGKRKRDDPEVVAEREAKMAASEIEQHRRKLGNAVRVQIEMGNYVIAARCGMVSSCPYHIFESLIVPNANKIVPSNYTRTSPVILCQIKGTPSIGNIFGVSKIRGGNRYSTYDAVEMDLTYQPETQE